ncbi:hypothetical protein ACI76O_05505 [Capnocytophaga cynodegmi]
MNTQKKINRKLPKLIKVATTNGLLIQLRKKTSKEIKGNRPSGYVCLFK